MTSAVIFPGQGSQALGMLNDLPDEHRPLKRSIFERVSARLGFDVLELIANGPQQRLNQTEITQPVLLGVNHLFWRIHASQHPAPHSVAGQGTPPADLPPFLVCGVNEFKCLSDDYVSFSILLRMSNKSLTLNFQEFLTFGVRHQEVLDGNSP